MSGVRALGWPLLVGLLLAPLCLYLAFFSGSEIGGLEYWPLSAVGAAAVLWACITRRQWVSLLLLIPLAAPLVLGAMLLLACLMGDCV